MAINTLDDFFKIYQDIYQVQVPAILISNEARKWTLEQIGFTDPLLVANLVRFIDRSALNTLFEQYYASTSPAQQKGTAMIKIAISFLYSYAKGLVSRHKTRLQIYRDDLSQKGARTMVSFAQSYRSYKAVKAIMEAS